MGHTVLADLGQYLNRDRRSVAEDLVKYSDLLIKWQKVQNLVSRETIPNLWTRHMADSLQLLRHMSETDQRILDLGSGGGFPALPLAIAKKTSSTSFVLVEANKRKATFLRTVTRELGLSVEVFDKRLEELSRNDIGHVDLITSRAVAPLNHLFALTCQFWRPGTRALLHKGGECGEELGKAGSDWSFDVVQLASETDRSGVILDIRNLASRRVHDGNG